MMSRLRVSLRELLGFVALASLVIAPCRSLGVVGLAASAPFLVTGLVARVGSSSRRCRRWLLGTAVVGTLILPFLAAITVNHAIWGYFVARPSVDSRIVGAQKVEAMSFAQMRPAGQEPPGFVGTAVGSVDDHIRSDDLEGDYYLLSGRVLRDLKASNRLPSPIPPIPSDRLDGLYQALLATGRLEASEPPYTNGKQLGGIVVEAISRDGRPVLFVGAHGGEVSNDHHPYYEFLFARDANGRPAQLLSFQRFYYDVAGIEGIEWPVFFIPLALLALVPTLILQGILVWGLRNPPPSPPAPL
jgi:hypothetical protein